MKKLLQVIALACLSFYAVGQINDPFFQQVSFRGAFGTEDWTQGWANFNPQQTNYPTPTVTVSGEITGNVTWTANNTYLLEGYVYVVNGATLTIEPGTVIRGDKNTQGSLIVEQGGKIYAVGTKNNPIVFTSNEAPGNRDYGDWGGLVICGKAPMNQTTAQIEGGPRSYYGGNDPNDNSGKLKYVRIEFAGIPFQPNKEINGLTLGAVGKGTEIEYIQVSYCGDDAFEWFGGTVNCKYLISFANWDDDFDTDYGYSGNVQFAVALRDPNAADVSGSNGFESDNDASGSSLTPKTTATFSNISVFGPKFTSSTQIDANFKRGMHLRRNTAISIYNSVITGFPVGLLIDGSGSESNATNNELKIRNTTIAGCNPSSFFAVASGSTWDIRGWYFTPAFHNDTLANNSDLKLTDPFNLTSPNFLPLPNSPLLNSSCWVSVKENQISEIELSIYPNPVSDIINIYINNNIKSDNIKIEILDIVGRIVYTKEFDSTDLISCNVSELKKGLYLLKVSVDNNTTVKRFNKE